MYPATYWPEARQRNTSVYQQIVAQNELAQVKAARDRARREVIRLEARVAELEREEALRKLSGKS